MSEVLRPDLWKYAGMDATPSAGNPKRLVFVSYSEGDESTVRDIVDAVEASGEARCWAMFRDVHRGDYTVQINSAIGQADVLLLVYSKQTSTSRGCAREVGLAADSDKPIIPLMLDDTPLSEMFRYNLSNLHRLDWRKPDVSAHLHHEVLGTKVSHGSSGDTPPAGPPSSERVTTPSARTSTGVPRLLGPLTSRPAIAAGFVVAAIIGAVAGVSFTEMTDDAAEPPAVAEPAALTVTPVDLSSFAQNLRIRSEVFAGEPSRNGTVSGTDHIQSITVAPGTPVALDLSVELKSVGSGYVEDQYRDLSLQSVVVGDKAHVRDGSTSIFNETQPNGAPSPDLGAAPIGVRLNSGGGGISFRTVIDVEPAASFACGRTVVSVENWFRNSRFAVMSPNIIYVDNDCSR